MDRRVGSAVILRHHGWENGRHLLAVRQDQKLPTLYFNPKTQQSRINIFFSFHHKTTYRSDQQEVVKGLYSLISRLEINNSALNHLRSLRQVLP